MRRQGSSPKDMRDLLRLNNTSFLGNPEYQLRDVVSCEMKTIAGGKGFYALTTYETTYNGNEAWITICDTSMVNVTSLRAPHYTAKCENPAERMKRKMSTLFGHTSSLSSYFSLPILPRVYDMDTRKQKITVIRPDIERCLEGKGKIGLEDRTYVYIVTEPLHDKITVPLNIDDAIGLFAKLARGLKTLHEKEVYHQRINPDIIIGSVNAPKLTGFYDGRKKELGHTMQTMMNLNSMDIAHLAPEISNDSQNENEGKKAMDVYGLGVTLYHALTGNVAANGNKDHREIIDNICAGNLKFEWPEHIRDDKRFEGIDILMRTSTQRDMGERLSLDDFIAITESLRRAA